MAALVGGETRKRSNTGGSMDDREDDRVILLAPDGTTNIALDSDVSDDNQEDSVITLIRSNTAENSGLSKIDRLRKKRMQLCRKPRYKRVWMAISVTVLGCVLLLMVAVPLGIWSERPKMSCSDLIDAKEFAPYIFDPANRGKFILCHSKEPLVEGNLGLNHNYLKHDWVNRYDYDMNSILNLTRPTEDDENCVRVEWRGTASVENPLMDCFDVSDDYWFGGYESLVQNWPINGDSRTTTAFLPRDYYGKNISSDFGPILHPVWLSSKGVVIFVDMDVPLHVSFNKSGDTKLCLKSVPHNLKCLPGSMENTILFYTVCGFENISRAAQFFLYESNNVDLASRAPSSDIFEKPIWSTSSVLQGSWTQDDLLEFATNITAKGYPISQLEISDGYTEKNGDITFSSVRFPSIASVIGDLGDISVTATVHPFIEYDSAQFTKAVSDDRLYPGQSSIQGDDIVLVKWWNGYGAVINYLDEDTRSWRKGELNNFINSSGLSSLRFAGGTDTHLPNCVYVENITSPVQYTRQYVDFVASQPYSSRAVVSVGYFSQKHPLLFRLLDRNTSLWGINNGLQSVLTATLSLGMAGYPFVYPDRNGGEGDIELYVRWLQLTAFFPVMQISNPPWRFNKTIETHIKFLIKLHREVYKNYTEHLVNGSSYPIIRPLWWVEPTNPDYIKSNDQFLVGNTLLVAPILNKMSNGQNTINRTVRIPTGMWKCLSPLCTRRNTESITGPTSDPVTDIGLTDLLYYRLCDNQRTC